MQKIAPHTHHNCTEHATAASTNVNPSPTMSPTLVDAHRALVVSSAMRPIHHHTWVPWSAMASTDLSNRAYNGHTVQRSGACHVRNSKLNNTRCSWRIVGQLGHNWCEADIIPQSVQCVSNLGGRKIHCRGAKRRPQTGHGSASQRRQVGQGMGWLALGLEMMPLHALQRREFWQAPSLGACDGV